VGDADLASVDRKQLAGFVLAHKNSLHLFVRVDSARPNPICWHFW
jgi:hypothetical protein